MNVYVPPEIWTLVLGFSPNATTFAALARVSKNFAIIAHSLQNVMKEKFSTKEEYETLDENNNLIVSKEYFILPNKIRHGPYVLYELLDSSDSELIATKEGNYKDGEKHGFWKRSNGNHGTYVKGKKYGTWFGGDYQTFIMTEYLSNLKHGTADVWSQDAATTGIYVNGIPDGPWIFWSSLFSKECIPYIYSNYSKPPKWAVIHHYYGWLSKEFEGTIREGKCDGVWKRWKEYGSLCLHDWKETSWSFEPPLTAKDCDCTLNWLRSLDWE
uniref:F-box domain-containing protein n=1 Tax=Marseillevirus LCMAC102 TaxID=2506603 RepID=A0A481YSQ6_9VIRU|nr:MAG: hypothetical protein LCMAC102_01080 [Marseillevirus LCMAC102]